MANKADKPSATDKAGSADRTDNVTGAGSADKTDNVTGAGSADKTDNVTGAGSADSTAKTDNVTGAGGADKTDNVASAGSTYQAGSADVGNRGLLKTGKTSTETAGKSLWERLNDQLYEYYVAPYRRTFARAQRDEEDLFMLLVFAESLGVPNPAAYYTMELLPVVYERFHEWHKRMGMERSPLDHVHCC